MKVAVFSATEERQTAEIFAEFTQLALLDAVTKVDLLLYLNNNFDVKEKTPPASIQKLKLVLISRHQYSGLRPVALNWLETQRCYEPGQIRTIDGKPCSESRSSACRFSAMSNTGCYWQL